MIYTNELYHHGIKGMHWGVRRYRNEDGSLTEAGKRKAKRERAEDAKIPRKKMNQMSNDELRKKAERLELENRVGRAENEHRGRHLKRAAETIATIAAVPTALVGVGALVVRAYDTANSLDAVASGTRVNGKNLYGAALEQYRKAQKAQKAQKDGKE